MNLTTLFVIFQAFEAISGVLIKRQAETGTVGKSINFSSSSQVSEAAPPSIIHHRRAGTNSGGKTASDVLSAVSSGLGAFGLKGPAAITESVGSSLKGTGKR